MENGVLRSSRALALLVLVACGKSPREPPAVVWYDLEPGEALARKEAKPVIVFAFAEWSVADKELDARTFPDREVREALRDFIAIRIDLSDEEAESARRAQHRFGVLGVPTILVTDDLGSYPELGFGYSGEKNPHEMARFNEFLTPAGLVPALRSAKRTFDRNASRR